MRPIIISLGLFLTAALTADAIKCFRCLKKNSDTCEEESVDCPDATQCLTVSESYDVRNETYHSIQKGCNRGFPCETGLYATDFNEADLRAHVHCCSGDYCNKDNYNFPLETVEHKGKMCPSCFGDGMHECISDRKVRCIHPEDQCVNYIGRIIDPGNNIKEYNLRGCLSPLGCQIQFKALTGVNELECKLFICTPGE